MYFAIRRVFEKIISIFLLILFTPLLVIIGIIIKVDSSGPIIFKQMRVGKFGKPYCMYKFRTMLINAQLIGSGIYSFNKDPRITRVGRVLRKTSLDELPQIINIIKGEMSFIGPRSPVFGYFPEYLQLNDSYKKRFSVLPGITGFAQVVGRNDLSWDEKIEYDNLYIDKVKKYGLLFDIYIVGLTISRVFSMTKVSENPENREKNIECLKNCIYIQPDGKENQVIK